MPCYHPRPAWRVNGGSVSFKYPRGVTLPIQELTIPCGGCIGCRMSRAKEWAIRCMHEAHMHRNNCFITLTYDDAHLPEDGSLNHEHFQLFMKRLRDKFKHLTIRYYMAGEYGTLNQRPHYHAILFGIDFTDKVFFRQTPARGRLYCSETLARLWGMGFVSVGVVTFSSAAYVAKYCMKKVTGAAAKQHYERVNLETGEVYSIKQEYNKASNRMGIGAAYFHKYVHEMYPSDTVISEKREVKPPRYYDKLYDRIDPEGMALMKLERQHAAKEREDDNTRSRLAVKEIVAQSKYRRTERGKFTYEAY